MSLFKENHFPENNEKPKLPDVKEPRFQDGKLEIDLPILKTPKELPRSDIPVNPQTNPFDIFKAAFEKLGLHTESSENKSETNESTEKKDYSDYLEKGEDGQYYDKENGKSYDSIEAWEKAQETLAKRYEGTARYFDEKANKELEKFMNAEDDAEKWEHYRNAQEYFAKAKDCQEKAAKNREKLAHNAETQHDNATETRDENTSEQKTDSENESNEVNPPIQNKLDGLEREKEVQKELEEKYPESEGYQIVSEAYLRDKDGKIVRDTETGEARRIDFVVVKDGKVVASIEVTSMTANKEAQSAKEQRIRDAGGTYIKDSDGNIIEIPKDVTTTIERRP